VTLADSIFWSKIKITPHQINGMSFTETDLNKLVLLTVSSGKHKCEQLGQLKKMSDYRLGDQASIPGRGKGFFL
jgi:hypothetical protein